MHFRDDYRLFPSYLIARPLGMVVVGPLVFAVNNLLLLGLSPFLYRPWVSFFSVDLFVRECEALVVMLGEECVGARVELTLV
jgi:hypothetical protein